MAFIVNEKNANKSHHGSTTREENVRTITLKFDGG
jgi:hypothetical protein